MFLVQNTIGGSFVMYLLDRDADTRVFFFIGNGVFQLLMYLLMEYVVSAIKITYLDPDPLRTCRRLRGVAAEIVVTFAGLLPIVLFLTSGALGGEWEYEDGRGRFCKLDPKATYKGPHEWGPYENCEIPSDVGLDWGVDSNPSLLELERRNAWDDLTNGFNARQDIPQSTYLGAAMSLTAMHTQPCGLGSH